METYIVLTNYTHQGVASIKDTPARIDEGRKAVEAVGGKIVGWYLTMGRYDVVFIIQVPDSKIAATLLLALGSQGNVQTETLRAFSEEEFRGIVAGLPQQS
jgi:uncharacterized protein with GYD domain